jgi:eukaryotic-like serine/threonine-protein kinase
MKLGLCYRFALEPLDPVNMALAVGSTLGPYELVAPIGAGGMGEVWRARDTRLERFVALKVLPAHLASSPELRQRLEREARAISSLSHPNICTLYDIGHQDGIDFLVMEFIDGETLFDRLAKGALPLDQVLRYAIEIAGALDKAHKQGVVHRDLKPANIMITKSGAKLLDFGLARLVENERSPIVTSITSLPTKRPDLTAEGMILGTFQYMAPEQLEGREADSRTDIFAFGAVLYEMTTGRKAFEGRSQASLIAAILSREPVPISSIQPMSPPALDRLVRTCLAKDPDDRWQSARDLLAELRWISEGGSQAGVPAPVAARRKSRAHLAWALATGATIVAAGSLTALYLARSGARLPSCPVRAFILAPDKARIDFSAYGGNLSVSPDGRYMTFAATAEGGKRAIWLRALDSLEARALPGTEDGDLPFWSPDSRYIAFFAQEKLKKIDIAGAPPVLICDAQRGRSGAWNKDGVILFAPSTLDPIHRVSSAGGASEPVTKIDSTKGETTHRWVTFLPDGRHFLFMAAGHGVGANSQTNGIYAAELGSESRKLVLTTRSNVAYANGRLLYVRDGVLLAQPFDLERLELSGDPVPIAGGVQMHQDHFRADFAVSENGVLAYRPGSGGTEKLQLYWYDRQGQRRDPVGEPAAYGSIALSPDETLLAMSIFDAETGNSDIWISDLARGTRTRLTFGALSEDSPVWSPDGTEIVYEARPTLFGVLMLERTDGSGKEQLLLAEDHASLHPVAWSKDGRYIVFVRIDQDTKTKGDLWVLPLFGDRKPFPFLATEFDEGKASLSPDGKWICYLSDESGKREVYVSPFPQGGKKWQVSIGGAGGGTFQRQGREIIFGTGTEIHAVDVGSGPSGFHVGRPVLLFNPPPITTIAISEDGQRFLMSPTEPLVEEGPFALVIDWPALVGGR